MSKQSRSTGIDHEAARKWFEENADFTWEETQRRAAEVMRRCAGMKQTFSLETGQPYEGEQIDPSELRRRGY